MRTPSERKPEVEDYVMNSPLDLAAGTTVNGIEILTDLDSATLDWNNLTNIPTDIADGDDLNALTCTDGQTPVWNGNTGTWLCDLPQAVLGPNAVIGESINGITFPSLQQPTIIPDANSVGHVSSIQINNSETIQHLSRDLSLTHTDIGELSVTLMSPSGTSIQVLNPTHQGQTDFDGNIGWSIPFASGNNLSFSGEDTVGSWTLRVVDNIAGNSGLLNSWGIRINEEWSGSLYVGDRIRVGNSLDIDGELNISKGADLVMKDSNGVETFRISGSNPNQVVTTANFAGKMYTNTSPMAFLDNTVECNAGDVALSGGCQTELDFLILKKSVPEGNTGWTCSVDAQRVAAYVRCLDL